ncbi:MAG TPA: VOC family protein [Acidimicrobiales bacterium]|jgi:catechol-2,3-dioxygenase|nr:VOC family protein [Acidimicrobiales bacterium]
MNGRSRTQWWGVCLDARDPHLLARFYALVLGWPVSQEDENGAAIAVPGTTSFISFQRNDDFVAPTWPGKEGEQQMMIHLDVAVDDLDAAVTESIALGATLAQYQPQDSVRVLLDPEGHQFCLYADPDLA